MRKKKIVKSQTYNIGHNQSRRSKDNKNLSFRIRDGADEGFGCVKHGVPVVLRYDQDTTLQFRACQR